MKYIPIIPPRVFEVRGQLSTCRIKDCAHIKLEPDEQVTFETETGAEYDVTRKSWGYYAIPSLNGRLKHFGLRSVLVKNSCGKYYIWLVENNKEADFLRYLKMEKHKIITWLDTEEALEKIEKQSL